MDNYPDGHHSLDDPAERPVVCGHCDREIGDHEITEDADGTTVCVACYNIYYEDELDEEDDDDDDNDFEGDAF